MTGFEHYITDMYEYGENTENLNSWSRSAILWGVDNGVYPLDGNMINARESNKIIRCRNTLEIHSIKIYIF